MALKPFQIAEAGIGGVGLAGILSAEIPTPAKLIAYAMLAYSIIRGVLSTDHGSNAESSNILNIGGDMDDGPGSI